MKEFKYNHHFSHYIDLSLSCSLSHTHTHARKRYPAEKTIKVFPLLRAVSICCVSGAERAGVFGAGGCCGCSHRCHCSRQLGLVYRSGSFSLSGQCQSSSVQAVLLVLYINIEFPVCIGIYIHSVYWKHETAGYSRLQIASALEMQESRSAGVPTKYSLDNRMYTEWFLNQAICTFR